MIFQPILGIVVFLAIAYWMSEDRKNISWKNTGIGFLFVFLISILFTKVEFLVSGLSYLNGFIQLIDQATTHATSFMFGYIGGGKEPFQVVDSGANFVIAFRVLPLIIVVSALSSLFFYLRIIPAFIKILSTVFERVFSISGPLGFGATSTIFLGTIEAPLVVRPYLAKMSEAELLALMSCTMATVSGSVMILYATVLSAVVENPLTLMIVASVISVPVALILSLIVAPLHKNSEQSEDRFLYKEENGNFVEAILKGTFEGLQMVLSIVAVILVLFAFIFLINKGLAFVSPEDFGELSLQKIFGFFLRPFIWLTGLTWEESQVASELMATKIMINEFVAYLDLAKIQDVFSLRSKTILIFSLCGFANLGSVGIIAGGLRPLLPGKEKAFHKLVFKSLVIGNLASLVTGCIIGCITALSL